MDTRLVKDREKLFYEILEYYKKLSNEDGRYKKAYERFAKGRKRFMEGWTHVQVIKNKKM